MPFGEQILKIPGNTSTNKLQILREKITLIKIGRLRRYDTNSANKARELGFFKLYKPSNERFEQRLLQTKIKIENDMFKDVLNKYQCYIRHSFQQVNYMLKHRYLSSCN